MRALIADWDTKSREFIASVLQGAGHEVEVASNGLQALEKVRTNSPRLVIAGWELEGMDGVALTRAIRANQTAGYVYVILLRGQVGSANAVEALSAGADDFLTNPFDPTELSVRVRTAERILSIETRDLV